MQSSAGIIVQLVVREAGQVQSRTPGTCECVCGERYAYNMCEVQRWGWRIGGTTSQGMSLSWRALTELLSRVWQFLHSLGSCREVQVPPTTLASALQPLPAAQPGTHVPLKVRDQVSSLCCGFGARSISRTLRVWCRGAKFPTDNNRMKSLPLLTREISHSLTEIMSF